MLLNDSNVCKTDVLTILKTHIHYPSIRFLPVGSHIMLPYRFYKIKFAFRSVFKRTLNQPLTLTLCLSLCICLSECDFLFITKFTTTYDKFTCTINLNIVSLNFNKFLLLTTMLSSQIFQYITISFLFIIIFLFVLFFQVLCIYLFLFSFRHIFATE